MISTFGFRVFVVANAHVYLCTCVWKTDSLQLRTKGTEPASNSLSRRSPSLIARLDRDNRFYRASNAVRRLVASVAVTKVSLSLLLKREKKRRKKGHKSDPLI